MKVKKFTSIAAFLIAPLILLSLGSALSSLTRIYVSSGTFVFSIILGALVTSVYYARSIRNKALKIGLILIFGVLVPILYINAAHEIFGTGIREYSDTWSPIYLATMLIGLIEIILYTWIITSSFIMLVKGLVIKIIMLIYSLIKKIIFLTKNSKHDSSGVI